MLAAVTAAYVLLFAALTLVRWNAWNYGRDLGIFAQAVWNTPHLFANAPEGGSHFAYHFSPLLAVFWPLLLAWKSPLALQFAQLLMTASTGFLVFAIFRKYADEKTAVCIGLFALLNPFAYPQAFNEFHEVAPFFPLALLLIWALDRERWGYAALLTALCCCVREDCAMICAILFGGVALMSAWRAAHISGTHARGLLYFEPLRPLRATVCASLLVVLCAATMWLYFGVIAPHFGGWHPSEFYHYSFANGPAAVVIALVVAPQASWPVFFTMGRLTYAFEAIAAFAALPFRSRWLIFALPGLATVLLSNSGGVWRIGAHYVILWLPFAFVAFGMAALSLSPLVRKRWFITTAAIVAVISIAGNPLHVGTYLKPSYHDRAAAAAAMDAAGTAPLATHDEWQTRYSLRNLNANDVLAPGESLYIYARDYPDDRIQREVLPQVDAMQARGELRQVRREGDVITWQRVQRQGAP